MSKTGAMSKTAKLQGFAAELLKRCWPALASVD
jgi:hypothetical protein